MRFILNPGRPRSGELGWSEGWQRSRPVLNTEHGCLFNEIFRLLTPKVGFLLPTARTIYLFGNSIKTKWVTVKFMITNHLGFIGVQKV